MEVSGLFQTPAALLRRSISRYPFDIGLIVLLDYSDKMGLDMKLQDIAYKPILGLLLSGNFTYKMQK
jgi:hypothetical protein